MPRAEFSNKTKALAFQRAAGFCEGTVVDPQGGMVRCCARLTVGKFAYDHVVADGLRKDNSLGNCAVLCLPCHGDKTPADVRAIARAKRLERRQQGIVTKSRRPISGRGFRRSERMAEKTPKADALRRMRETSAPRIGAFKVKPAPKKRPAAKRRGKR